MKTSRLKRLQGLFLCLSDVTRLRIVEMLASGERSVGEFVEYLQEAQPKISRHLATMRDQGIVSTRREGKHIYYSLNRAISPPVVDALVHELSIGDDGPGLVIGDEIYAETDMHRRFVAERSAGAEDALPIFLL